MRESLKDIILGGQDGLVNVLGILLAMAGATHEVRIILIAGLAATFAESLSMAGVGYTSTKAIKDYYRLKLKEEEKQSEENMEDAKEDIRRIYAEKGFEGTLLNKVVNKIVSDKKVLVETMMREELNLSLKGFGHPIRNAFVIGFAAIIGSLVPLLPFFFVDNAIVGVGVAMVLSVLVLFVTGAYKAKLTVGKWWKEGLELAVVGIGAAVLGYMIGLALGMIF